MQKQKQHRAARPDRPAVVEPLENRELFSAGPVAGGEPACTPSVGICTGSDVQAQFVAATRTNIIAVLIAL